MVDSTTVILDDNQISNFQALHNLLSLEKVNIKSLFVFVCDYEAIDILRLLDGLKKR